MFKKISGTGSKGFIIAAFVLITAIVIHPPKSFAYRPFVTEDAGVAGKGVTQLEVSWDYLKWGNGDKEDIFLFVPIHGITDRIELSLEIPYLFHNPKEENSESGVGDIYIVGKFLISEEKDFYPAFALKGVIKTDSGNEKKGLGSGDWDYSLVAAISKGFGDLILHAMLGYTFVGDNGDKNIRNTYLYGIAADYGFTKKFHVVSEIAGNRHPDRREKKNPQSGLLGVTYAVSEKLILDTGIRFGFNNSAPKWNIFTGISITF